MRLAVGLVLALGSAGALNYGFYAQHGAVSGLPRLSLRRPLRSLRLLFSNRRWLGGFVLGIAGWALYVAALALAPLSLVQAVSAGGIGLLALLVSRSGAIRLSPLERAGVAASLAGLVLLGVSLVGTGHAGRHARPSEVGLWVAISIAVAAMAAAGGARVLAPGAGFGLAAGLLYSAGDVATKAAVGGGAALAFVAAVLACHGLGFVSLQLGFQRGGALATAGVATLLLNALPIGAGMWVFREGLPPGLLGATRAAAFVAVVVGAAALAAPGRAEAVPVPA